MEYAGYIVEYWYIYVAGLFRVYLLVWGTIQQILFSYISPHCRKMAFDYTFISFDWRPSLVFGVKTVATKECKCSRKLGRT